MTRAFREMLLAKDMCVLERGKVRTLCGQGKLPRHMIDEKGLQVDTDKMAKIHDWNRPCNFKDVQRFLAVIYTKPPILIGLHWIPEIPTGLQWIPVDSSGLHQIPQDSTGF